MNESPKVEPASVGQGGGEFKEPEGVKLAHGVIWARDCSVHGALAKQFRVKPPGALRLGDEFMCDGRRWIVDVAEPGAGVSVVMA